MPMETRDAEVVIVGDDGAEHVFPPGFDPKRAAGIVRQQSVTSSSKATEPSRGILADLGLGAAKGLAESTSNVVGMVPGVTRATNAIGNYLGGKAGEALYGRKAPEVSMAQTSDALKASNTPQQIGKVGEQIAEFMVPANAARQASIKSLVRMIPGSASPTAMRTLNKVGALAGRAIGEAGSAGAVAAAHGQDPMMPAAIAGAGPLVAGPAAATLASRAMLRNVVPTLAAGGVMHAAGGPMSMLGFPAMMGTYGAIRKGAERALVPNQRAIGDAIRKYLPILIRTGAAGFSEAQE